jgi:predicted RNase H-like HicB family nuclease
VITLKNEYIFPAIFDYSDPVGIAIEFPDLEGCYSCASTTEEAVYCAKEVLELHLWGMEQDGDNIPEPTPINKLKLDKDCIPYLVSVWMPVVRSEMDNKAVKKTLTIPQWLNMRAEREGVNFSRILQEALKEHLNIKR